MLPYLQGCDDEHQPLGPPGSISATYGYCDPRDPTQDCVLYDPNSFETANLYSAINGISDSFLGSICRSIKDMAWQKMEERKILVWRTEIPDLDGDYHSGSTSGEPDPNVGEMHFETGHEGSSYLVAHEAAHALGFGEADADSYGSVCSR